jgi:hypothetical protein
VPTAVVVLVVGGHADDEEDDDAFVRSFVAVCLFPFVSRNARAHV